MRLFGRARRPLVTVCEYWVYLPSETMPQQRAIMARMMKIPPNPGCEESPIGPAEGVLFSDVRLHIALVLRAKNPHLFRPDLFDQHIVPTATILADLSEARAMVKLRYLSEESLGNDRHLGFMPHLADVVAQLGGARVIFDSVAETLQEAGAFHRSISRALSADFHLRIVWFPTANGGQAATRGLVKVGLPEIITPPTRPDHQSIVCEVLRLAAERAWETREVPDRLRLKCYDDTFLVEVARRRKPPYEARILRIADA